MIKEIDMMGVYLSPMMGWIAVTILLWFGIRAVLRRVGLYRWVWHEPLFNAALFVIILSGLVIATM
ncbi:MAG: DUF1656 domain-containing protein [Puniceicoccales bacterium]|jgi:hypothetical protein|nr:DUF1656 domain-containing protein [Puniceicoccales bacterium]